MARMKTETKRKIAGIIAGVLAAMMLLSSISFISGLAGSNYNVNVQATETTTSAQ